ncbi:MAG: 3-isopropylmalate dehydrogenase [Proteobacteria bacterium]|nr:3-isopropylmalate dehydrogenase [Pseudomonadota bacterium]
MSHKILLLSGDGIGREVVAEAEQVLLAVAKDEIEIDHALIGGVAIDTCGEPLPTATATAAAAADAVLLGAVGAPQYDHLPNAQKPEKGLLQLRKAMGVFANLRPAICYAELVDASTLKPEYVRDLDILIVRELLGDVYFGEPRELQTTNGVRRAVNTMCYDENEIARVARHGFEAARRRQKRLCSVEKANVLEVGMLWREVVSAIGQEEYPDIELSHLYVDNAAMQLVRAPKQFDVIVTGNIFGDILSDAAAMLTGSIGMLPSASLNESGGGLYEPVHGSAPDIAGEDKANPLATILSVAMLLRYSLNLPQAAAHIERAVQQTLADGYRTADIAAPGAAVVSCSAMGAAVRERLTAV